jgi:hypothetical protein
MAGVEEPTGLGPGVRVRVRRDPAWDGPWPSEPTGTIEPVLGEPFRLVEHRNGTVREFMVVFDEPCLDADGDGPYEAAVIWEQYLEPLEMDEVPPSAESLDRRRTRDEALAAVLAHPEQGVPVSVGGMVQRSERTAAALAMISFWLCSLFGQLLALWWARRHESLFARRYAWASLVFEGAVAVMMVPLFLAFFAWAPSASYLLVFAIVWLLQAALGILALVMAVRAWRGDDVADGPLPSWLTDRLPAE